MISGVEQLLLLFRRSLTLLNILQMGSVHRSWDFWICVRCVGNRRRDCEIGCEGSKIVFFAGCESVVGESEIGRAESGQSQELKK